MVKNRVVVMGADMRKSFIGTILVGLIEKTPDIKVMKAIAKVGSDKLSQYIFCSIYLASCFKGYFHIETVTDALLCIDVCLEIKNKVVIF